MKNVITKYESSRRVGEPAVYLFDDWFDPIEAGVRDRERGFKAAGNHNLLSGVGAARPFAARAQQPNAIRRIGIISPQSAQTTKDLREARPMGAS